MVEARPPEAGTITEVDAGGSTVLGVDAARATTAPITSGVVVLIVDKEGKFASITFPLLPDQSHAAELAEEAPDYFVPTAIDAAISRLPEGIDRNSCKAVLVGGSDPLDSHRDELTTEAALGRRNIERATQHLAEAGFTEIAQDTGGCRLRVLEIDLTRFEIRVTSPGHPDRTIEVPGWGPTT